MYVTLEGDRVILSKDQDEKVVTNETPMLDPEDKPNNYTSGREISNVCWRKTIGNDYSYRLPSRMNLCYFPKTGF